jgi:hypothetical protein
MTCNLGRSIKLTKTNVVGLQIAIHNAVIGSSRRKENDGVRTQLVTYLHSLVGNPKTHFMLWRYAKALAMSKATSSRFARNAFSRFF